MKTYLFSAALILSLNTFASGNESLNGTYECKDSDVINEAFTCQLTIKQMGDTYASTDTCSDGSSYRGTGIYDKNSHLLSTSFINPKNPKETGVSVLVIKENGELMSTWTYLDKTTISHTACHKI